MAQPGGFGEGNSMESLEKVLADTNKNVRAYLAWCAKEFPTLMKQATESGLMIKQPPQVSIFESGYPLFECLAKEADGWLRFDPSQKELLTQLTEYFKYPVYVEETEKGFSFLHLPFKREYPVIYSKGRTIKGRADLVIVDPCEKKKIGIEVDHLTIKLESALKLAFPKFDYRIFVLTGRVGMKEMAESLFTLTKFHPTGGWQNTLVMAKNRGFYLGYMETSPTRVVKGQIEMPLEMVQ